MGSLIDVKAASTLCTLSDIGSFDGRTYQDLSPEMIGAFAHSERRFSLPTWAQVLAAAPRAYGRDVEIFGQQEPADCLYKVVSGAVRTFSVLRDGRRHIAGVLSGWRFFRP